MQPGAGKGHKQFNSVRIWRIGYLAAVKFDLVNGRINQLSVNTRGDEIAQRFKY